MESQEEENKKAANVAAVYESRAFALDEQHSVSFPARRIGVGIHVSTDQEYLLHIYIYF